MWLTAPAHARWLEAETDRLLEFGRRSLVPSGGFARQGEDGAAQDGPLELWIACRMTHVYAIGHLLGRPGYAAFADHGVEAIRGLFADDEHGGWFAEVERDGTPRDDAKAAYPHAFVVLAASSATAAGRPGAAESSEGGRGDGDAEPAGEARQSRDLRHREDSARSAAGMFVQRGERRIRCDQPSFRVEAAADASGDDVRAAHAALPLPEARVDRRATLAR